MPLGEKEVLEILALFEKSDWKDLHLESGPLRLSVSKTGRPPELPGRTAPSTPRAVAPVAAAPAPAPVPAPPAPAEPIDPRFATVRSPTLGTFYVSPKPGAPPFVAVGQKVAEDDTVAIVEVMKLMNHVKAGAAGTIAKVLPENGDLVEYDQVLFLVDPA